MVEEKKQVSLCLIGHSIFQKRVFPILEQKVREDKECREEILEKINLLKLVCNKLEAFGLAAPQLGWCDRIILVRNSPDTLMIFVNPVVVEKEKKEESKQEFCYSLPGFGGQVNRSVQLTVEYLDEHFEQRKGILEGVEARILQHEMDHLEGKFITDLVKKQIGNSTYELSGLKNKIKKMRRLAKQSNYVHLLSM